MTSDHSLDHCLGDGSPLGRIHDLDGWILLLGVGHDRNTSLHLAEYRADLKERRLSPTRVPLLLDGRRQWVQPEDYELDESDFEKLGEAYELGGGTIFKGKIAQAAALLIPQRELVDFAVPWFEGNRG